MLSGVSEGIVHVEVLQGSCKDVRRMAGGSKEQARRKLDLGIKREREEQK